MPLSIDDAALVGVTESSLTLSFRIEDGNGPVDAPVAVRLDGEVRAVSSAAARTRLVRIEGLEPATTYRVGIEVDGAALAAIEGVLPSTVTTLAPPTAPVVASFATLDDPHFGESPCGGIGTTEPATPHWRFMNEDAVAEINAAGVDVAVIKGDVTHAGRREQFAAAAALFGGLRAPHHVLLGNHDYYAARAGDAVDGYAALGQPPAPRAIELDGWRLVLLDTALPGKRYGVLPRARLSWLADELAATAVRRMPTLLLMHHQPVAPHDRLTYPDSIGLTPAHSLRLFALLRRHPQVRGVLCGHTHRHRVRYHPAAGPVPVVEVGCSKDYPGGWAHYRLYADGSFRQEVRRIASARALAYAWDCRTLSNGAHRRQALGRVAARSFATMPLAGR